MKTLTLIRILTALLVLPLFGVPAPAGVIDPQIPSAQDEVDAAHAKLDIVEGMLLDLEHELEQLQRMASHEPTLPKISQINALISDMLTNIRETQRNENSASSTNSNSIATEIATVAYYDIKKLLNYGDSYFFRSFANHVATLFSLSIKNGLKHNSYLYRTSPEELVRPQTSAENTTHHQSTLDLAAQLTHNDLAVLALLIHDQAQNIPKVNADNTFHTHLISRMKYMTAVNLIFLSAYYSIYSIPTEFVPSLLPLAATFINYKIEHIFIRRKRTKLELTAIAEYQKNLEFFTSALQAGLGETAAAPLIAAIRSGDTDAIQNAACQYALTPRSATTNTVPQVRVELDEATQEAPNEAVANGAATKMAEL